MSATACLVSEVNVLPLESVPLEADWSPPLPDVSLKVPSDRDLQIYEEAVFAGLPQRKVAQNFGVSQPRVNQVLKEIAAWMADNTPNFVSGLTPEQKLRLVHYNVVQQLEHQRCVLMQAWEDSRHGMETISRTTIVNGVSRTTAINRPRQAKASFLDAAARVSMAIVKLAGWTPTVVVTDAPQNSPWWQMGEEEAESSRQEAESRRTEPCSVPLNTHVAESKSDLSAWDERVRKPNLTRAEMDAITAEQQAVNAALKVKVEELKAEIRKCENPLSLGTGPLLPEEGKGAKGTRKQGKMREERREFLREEPTITNIQDAFGRKTQLSG